MQRRDVQWAEMKPNLYGGDTCDQLVPGWSAHADGDKGDGENNLPSLELAARTFPPGTKVVISEPLCPKCGELREPVFPIPETGSIYSGPCDCGFDWDSWVQDNYC